MLVHLKHQQKQTVADGKNIKFTSNDFIPGDANGDGKLTALDAALLLKH